MLKLKFYDGNEYKIGALSLFNLDEAEEEREKENKKYTDLQLTLHLLYSSFLLNNPKAKATYKEFLKMFPLGVWRESQKELLELVGLKNPVKEATKKI